MRSRIPKHNRPKEYDTGAVQIVKYPGQTLNQSHKNFSGSHIQIGIPEQPTWNDNGSQWTYSESTILFNTGSCEYGAQECVASSSRLSDIDPYQHATENCNSNVIIPKSFNADAADKVEIPSVTTQPVDSTPK